MNAKPVSRTLMIEANSSGSPSHFNGSYFFRRAVATIVDYGIFFAFTFAYVYQFGSETSEGYQVQGCGHFLALLFAWIVWLPLPEALFGRTLGKWGFDLRVMAADGRRASTSQSFLRRLLDPIDLLLFFGLVGYVVAKTNALHQRVGDLVAKTRVVDERTRDVAAG
jgi:uncharacterized RDD family membrane protein YckC